MFYIVLKFKELLISLEPDVGLQWGYGSKCRVLYAQVDYIENSNLNIADKWLIFLDHVTTIRSAKRFFFHTLCMLLRMLLSHFINSYFWISSLQFINKIVANAYIANICNQKCNHTVHVQWATRNIFSCVFMFSYRLISIKGRYLSPFDVTEQFYKCVSWKTKRISTIRTIQ